MTKQSLVRLAICVAAVSLTALLAVLLTKAGYACSNPNKRAAYKIVEANGCIEFWFNRYQATIAAILGVTAALAVLLPATLQIAEARKQSAAAWHGVLDKLADDLRAEALQLGDIAAGGADLGRVINGLSVDRITRYGAEDAQILEAVGTRCRAGGNLCWRHDLADASGSSLSGARKAVLAQINAMSTALNNLQHAILEAGSSQSMYTTDSPENPVWRNRTAVLEAWSKMHSVIGALSIEIIAEIKRIEGEQSAMLRHVLK